ncbi:MAG: UTP--glucose-1-phosphate uridylyltransferase GalU [Dehalococcoidia bacterium]
MSIKKAVIPAAGVGTLFLPTTKAIPKELLPLLDKPLIQYAVEEAVASGIREIILVTSQGKEALERYFKPDPALESFLKDRGSLELQTEVRRVTSLAKMSYVEQKEPLGLGHAVLTAKDLVGDEPFAVMLPDDVIQSAKPALGQMIEVYHSQGGGVIAVEEVPRDQVSSYGVITPEPLSDEVYRIHGVVEKPPPEKAPSNLAIVGRYILPPEIFDCLERTCPGAKGEIQLTDGLALLMETQELYGYRFSGTRHDGGTPLGLLKASLAMALAREDTRAAILETIKQHLPA